MSQGVKQAVESVLFADIFNTATGVASISGVWFFASRGIWEPTMEHSLSTRRRVCPSHRAAALAILTAATMGVQAEGLTLRAQENPYSTRTAAEYALTNSHVPANSIRLFGDYYFFDPAQSNMGPTMSSLVGGFRASTGVVGLTQPLSLYDTRPDSLQNLPYIGLGYSHLWFNSQLSLNADFGLASQSGHGHGLFNNAASLDDVTSQLRWAPVMAVNVRYSF
jgi:hypothetical protein